MKLLFKGPIMGGLISLLLSHRATAQSTPDSAFATMLSPVTVYALKGQPKDSRVPLNYADWVKHDAGEVLQQVPGFSAVKKSGSFGFDPVFRGFKGDQLSILNDGGLTAHAACPNRMDPPASQVMINQVQAIEILSGPHNFRYGPATGAVVNFKTADPEFSAGRVLSGRINTGAESNGGVLRTEGMIVQRTPRTEWTLAGSYSAGGDYTDGRDSTLPAAFNRGAVNMKLAYKVSDKQVASLQVVRNFARDASFPTLMMDLLSDDTWMIQGRYDVAATGRWYAQWNTQVFTSLVDHQMGNRLRPASAAMLSHVAAHTQTAGGRTEFTVKKRNAHIYLGADMQHEQADGDRTRAPKTGPMTGKTFTDTLWQNSSRLRAGGFAHADLLFGKNEVSLSSRIDVVAARARDVATRFSGVNRGGVAATDVNPSISAGYNRVLTRQLRAGIWVGRGVRTASLTEKFINHLPVGLDAYEVVGNPQLKPEANTQLDLLLQYRSAATAIQLNLFQAFYHNFISSVVDPALKPVVPSAPGVRRFVNISEARFAGFELGWKQKLGKKINNEFTVTYTRAEDKELRQPLPEISPLEFRNRLDAAVYLEAVSAYIHLRHAAKQDRVSAAFKERTTEGFTVMDMGVKLVPVKDLRVTLAVTNVFDEAYREHLSRYISPALPLNAPGRSFVIMASYSF